MLIWFLDNTSGPRPRGITPQRSDRHKSCEFRLVSRLQRSGWGDIWAFGALASPVEYMGIDHRGFHVLSPTGNRSVPCGGYNAGSSGPRAAGRAGSASGGPCNLAGGTRRAGATDGNAASKRGVEARLWTRSSEVLSRW
jgi:hypothetical protein